VAEREKTVRTPRRYLVAAAAAFGLGVAAGRYLALPPEQLLTAAAGVAVLAMAAFFAKRRAALAAGALALAALAGALNFSVRSAQRPADDPGALLGLSGDRVALTVLTGRVEEVTPVPGPGRYSTRMLLAVESLGAPARSAPATGRVRLSLQGEEGSLPPGVRPGARVRLSALLWTPEPPRSPGAMDYPGYLATRGIWTAGSGQAALCQPLGGGAFSPGAALVRLRERLAGLIRRQLPEREGALLNTLLIGWRGEMDPEEELAFTRTGTGHLLAVSGIHVMLLVGAVWWALRMFRAAPRASAAALVAFAVGYAELAGARAPVVRAALMAALFLGGMVLAREADGLNSLAAAFLVILAAWPRELFSAGFQMSFAAVGFIMTVTPALEGAWQSWRGLRPEDLAAEKRERLRARAARWLRLSVFTSMAATLGTLPLIVSSFGVLSTWAVLVNLLAIPIAGLALALGLVFLAVGTILPPLAPVPAALVWGALRVLEGVVGAAERLPACALVADAPPGWLLLGFYLAAVGLLLAGRRLGRWRAPAVVAVLGLSVLVSVSGRLGQRPPPGERVTVLYTRHGQAAILEDRSGRSACFWAGGGREIADCLRAERLGRLDLVAIGADREGLLSGAGYLVRAGRARSFALPAGDALSPQLAELWRAAPGAGRLAADWRAALGGTELLALGAEPYARKDGQSRPRPLMILARPPGEKGVLFADLASGPSVRAAAAALRAGGLGADVLVAGFAWRPPRETAELLRASGARVALLALTPFENSEPAGRELAALCRRAGLRPLATAEHGSLRCTLLAGRAVLEHFEDGRWRPLGAVRLGRKGR